MTTRTPSGPTAHRTGMWAAALGVVGGAALVLVAPPAPAHANYPDPPRPAGSVAPLGAYESAPAACPDRVPDGTILTDNAADRDGRAICDRAESLAPTDQAAAAIRYGFSMLGAPYSQTNRYSLSPPVFDCSSFVSRAYDAANALITKNGSTYTWGRSGLLTYTGAYVPANYAGSNVTRVTSYDQLIPGDVIIEFDGPDPSQSAGNNGHAQLYLGKGQVIQSGGRHPDSLVNVDEHYTGRWADFSNEWYFRYNATKAIDPVQRKLAKVSAALGAQTSPTEQLPGNARLTAYANGVLLVTPDVGVRMLGGPVMTRWQDLGRENSMLGWPTSDLRAGSLGGSQFAFFQHGAIYWSASTGAVQVSDRMLSTFRAQGGTNGALGLPVSDEQPGALPGELVQQFQHGRIYWSSATGAQAVNTSMLESYQSLGADAGWLGLPISSEQSGPAGSRMQRFANGDLYRAGTATLTTRGAIGAYYRTSGIGSTIGLPTGNERATNGGMVQEFTGGRIYWSAATGAHEVYGYILGTYLSLGAENGWLGLPTTGEVSGPVTGSRASHFSNGSLYWSPSTGAVPVFGAIDSRYRTDAAFAKLIGLPTATMQDVGNGVLRQVFQQAWVYSSAATGVREVHGTILWVYASGGAHNGPLGVPTSDEIAGPAAGSRMSTFTKGTMYWTPAVGAVPVPRSALDDYYRSSGVGRIAGIPTAAEGPAAVAGARALQLQGGRILYSAATGIHEVYGGIYARYAQLGQEGGSLGLPVTGESDGPLKSRVNGFTNGAIYWSGPTGAWEVVGNGPIASLFRTTGMVNSVGLPTGPEAAARVAGARMQPFSIGRIYSSATTGAHEVYGGIGATYVSLGAETGPLGLPTSGEKGGPWSGSRMNTFTGGSLFWVGGMGYPTVGAIDAKYRDLYAVLGPPTSSERVSGVTGTTVQTFAAGRIYRTGGTAFTVKGGILTAYLGAGAETSKLGAPTSDEYTVAGGRKQNFAKGTIYYDSASGKTTLTVN